MMRKTIIDDKIKEAKKALNNGASLETVQKKLTDYVLYMTTALELDEKTVEAYNKQIAELGKKNHILYANKYAIGALALASTVLIGAAAFVGCNGSKKQKNNETKAAIEQETEKEVKPIEKEVEEEVNYVLPEHLSFDANDMAIATTNISEFINDALGKGLGTIKKDGKLVSSFKESTLSKKAQAYLNWYLVANINNIDYKVLAELNQQGNLTADKLYQDFIDVTAEIKNETFSSKEGLMLDKIFADKNDVEYINELTDLIYKINSTKNAKNNKKLVKKARKIKEAMLVDFAKQGIEVNAAAADYALTQLEIADALLNGKVITNDEDEHQLYNSTFKNCVSAEMKEKLGIKKVDGLVSSEVSLKSVFRNKYRMELKDKFDMALSYETKKDVTTSYNYVVENIKNNIDVNKFVANKYTVSDWLWLKTSDMTLKEKKEIESGKKVVISETKPQTNIDKKDVPVNERVKDKETTTETSTNKVSTKTYIKAKADAITNASRDVAKLYKKLGSSLKISKKRVPGKPSTTTTDYEKAYNYWYAVEFNATLKSIQKQERAAKKETKETFEDTKDKVIDSGEIDNNSNDKDKTEGSEEEFEEVDPVVVDEGEKTAKNYQNDIKELRSLKASLLSMVATETEALETSYVKTI